MNKTDRWRNRRKMAWLSLIAGLLYPLLVLFTDSPELGAIAMYFYLFISSVVSAYIGFATFDDKFQKDRYDYDNYNPSQRSNPVDYRDGLQGKDFER